VNNIVNYNYYYTLSPTTRTDSAQGDSIDRRRRHCLMPEHTDCPIIPRHQATDTRTFRERLLHWWISAPSFVTH